MLENHLIDQSNLIQSTTKTIYQKEVLKDFQLACLCREVSYLARKEVLNGRAKFGVTADGKEVPQIAMARAFQKGDFWAGYYRDQTFMFHKGMAKPEDYFATLYADAVNDPFCGGRQMVNHFGSQLIDKAGKWTNHKEQYNASVGVSCTAGSMARGLGLALASQKYRNSGQLKDTTSFSNNGNEVIFCTIGDASTSEGVFFETINAACVTRVPLAVFVWDDGYGISVPAKYQTTKQNISEILEGFRLNEKGEGMEIYTLKAWDYKGLCEAFKEGIQKTRTTHIPVLFHVQDCTQQQGHSTSGSHERYKSKERLAWERQMDCNLKMAHWLVQEKIATQAEIDSIKTNAKQEAKACRDRAWKAYSDRNKQDRQELERIYTTIFAHTTKKEQLQEIYQALKKEKSPVLSDLIRNARQIQYATIGEKTAGLRELEDWLAQKKQIIHQRYHTHLYSATEESALKVPVIPPTYSDSSPIKNGFEVINAFFDKALAKHDNLFAFGEDVGKIGDVNQGFAGLQKKYGEERVFDVGIREWTIVGQAIGMAARGLRPIADIQYLDYLAYGLEPLTDDLATLRYRSNGHAKAPAIIRTRGHRLEGIWHSGSPMGMILNAIRGMYFLVPRNFTQAAGLYNTMLQSDDPAILVECLNAYRLKEKLPDNMGTYTVPLGVPEILQTGTDITLVTYGSCVRIAQAGID